MDVPEEGEEESLVSSFLQSVLTIESIEIIHSDK